MRLVHEKPINPQLLKSKRVILLFIGREFLELPFEPFLRPLQRFHDARVVLLLLLLDGKTEFAQFRLDEFLLGLA